MPHYRKNRLGRKYRQCEAQVDDENFSGETRLCRREAVKGDRLCGNHKRDRLRVNRREPKRFIITVNKKGVQPSIRRGRVLWPRFVIGKIFNSYEDADLYSRLNSTLIFAIPNVKSYCIERYR